MHQPGYIQGGQEVGRGYLLLGIHYRRIREHSTLITRIKNDKTTKVGYSLFAKPLTTKTSHIAV
jgi:hypothetical protein